MNTPKKKPSPPFVRDVSRYKKLKNLRIPQHLHRNSWIIREAGYIKTGQYLLDLTLKRLGEKDFSNSVVLDMGCGVRFTQTIINNNIDFKKYLGVEVNPNLVMFLKRNVETFDDRFEFHYWPCYNEKFSPRGLPMMDTPGIPIGNNKEVDIILGFSLFTHLNPEDSYNLLCLMRKVSSPNAKLFFSAFVDEESGDFEDRMEGKPLSVAYYKKSYFEGLIDRAGWKIEKEWKKEMYIQHAYFCTLK